MVGLALLLAGPALAESTPADTGPPTPVAVISAKSAANLEPIAPAVADWVERRLGEAGIETLRGIEVRRAIVRSVASTPETPELLGVARSLGAERAVLIDLSFREGEIDVLLRLHRSSDARLLGAGREQAAAKALAESAGTALGELLMALGASPVGPPDAENIALEKLAARSRALLAFDAGHLARALRELDGDQSADAVSLRAEIDTAAARDGVTREEKARVLAARGAGEEAWRLILRDASEQLYSARPDPALMLAAGEVQEARGKLNEAQAYYRRAREVEPNDLDATLGLGRVQVALQDAAAAKQTLAEAESLDPASPHPTFLQTQLTNVQPSEAARVRMRAATRSAELMDRESTMEHLRQAVAADPRVEADAEHLSGRFHQDMGDHAAAEPHLRRSVEVGGSTVERERDLGKTLQALRDRTSAEAAYQRAMRLGGDDPDIKRDLADLYEDSGRYVDARKMLEQVEAAEPGHAPTKRALARNLEREKDYDRALPLLEEAEQIEGPTPDGLRTRARIERAMGDDAAAEKTLERAVRLEPTNVALHQDLGELYETLGRGEKADKQYSLVEHLGGARALRAVDARSRLLMESEGRSRSAAGQAREEFEALLASFGAPPPGGPRAILLGVTRSTAWRDRLGRWIDPTNVDLEAIAVGLAEAIDARYQRLAAPDLDPELSLIVGQLLDFDSPGSLDPDAVAMLNHSLDTGSVFIARVYPGSFVTGDGCAGKGRVMVELRRASGRGTDVAEVLGNRGCVPAQQALIADWNPRALAVWGSLLAMIVAFVVRGWGAVQVKVQLPPKTRALFAVSVTRSPRKFKSSIKSKEEGEDHRSKDEINNRLKNLHYSEKRLKGKEVLFRWLPARKAHYYVTLRGPLFDSMSEELVGDFLEERKVRVKKGEVARVAFDLQPKECAVQLTVLHMGDPAKNAQVAVRGKPDSMRYLGSGPAFVYLPKGTHTLAIGGSGHAMEQTIEIEELGASKLNIDLGRESEMAIEDCPEAVPHFIEGNYEGAASALESAGQEQAALRMRARAAELRGDNSAASRFLEKAGATREAADLLADGTDAGASAQLYEDAGDYGRAAEVYTQQGDLASAARCHEAAYDFESAIECYRQLGDDEKLLFLLEKNGDFYEAGELCMSLGQTERAIHLLQQVDVRAAHYSEVCRTLGTLLADQGNVDFALEKFDAAMERAGLGSFPIELQDRYAKLLEDAGRLDDAVDVLGSIRRQDLHYGDVSTRIESLKHRLTAVQTGATSVGASPPPAAPTATPPPADGRTQVSNGRYELVEQIGAGGMGVVYRARDTQLGREVALKRLPENLRQHPTAVKFFEREARSAAALNHPNIVTVYDAGQENGQYFMTMELLEGTPLDVIANKRGALPPLVVCQLGVQVATGLHFAHRNKIIHRDIKTANLFLTRDKIVKIMDFGLAKMTEEVRKGATVIGGTPYYMSPEQAAGSPDVDHRADLYSLGITLYQLATANLPFTEGDIGSHHQNTPPPDPRTHCPHLPEPLARVILKLIEKAPEDRYQKAAEVARDLQAIAQALGRAKKS